jgi:hypothetical protein
VEADCSYVVTYALKLGSEAKKHVIRSVGKTMFLVGSLSGDKLRLKQKLKRLV